MSLKWQILNVLLIAIFMIGILKVTIFTKKNSENFQLSNERTPGTYQKHASLDDKLDDLHYYITH